jgi:hypothetical protein
MTSLMNQASISKLLTTISISISISILLNIFSSVCFANENNNIAKEHSLIGAWTWVFLDTNAAHSVKITEASNYMTHSEAKGTIQLAKDLCPLTMTVYNQAKTSLTTSINNTVVAHDGYVMINITCQNSSIVAMAFGLPSTRAAILGRADVKVGKPTQLIPQPFAMSRPE